MSKYEGPIIILLSLIGAMFWYKLWVEPHDEYREKIMKCMSDDRNHSRAAYDKCAEELRGKK